MTLMRTRPWLFLGVVASLLAAACTGPAAVAPPEPAGPARPKGDRKGSPSPAPKGSVKPTGNAAPTTSPSNPGLAGTPPGATAFFGRVVGQDGNPVAGVLVRGFIISDGGLGLISDQGGSVVANNGGGLVGQVRVPYRLAAPYGLSQVDAVPVETTTKADGTFELKDPTGRPLNLEADDKAGLKAFKPGVAADAKNVELKLAPTGTISGKVVAPGRPSVTNFLGVDVFIPGSSYVAKTDAAGAYTLRDVPVGAFDVVGAKAGLGKGLVRGVAVESQKNTAAGDLPLEVKPPNITALSVESGGPGALVRISGENFGASSGETLGVTFGGAAATAPVVVDDRTLEVKVPDGAVSGDVVVRVSDIQGTAKPFKVIRAIAIVEGHKRVVVGAAAPTFTAVARDQAGAEIAGAALGWKVEGDAVSADSAGKITIVKAGVAKVAVSSGAITETRVIEVATKEPQVATIAGTGAIGRSLGDGAVAQFEEPRGVVVDATGQKLYMADANNDRIVMIDLADARHTVTTLAGDTAEGFLDGPAATAQLDHPQALALDLAGKKLYFGERDTKRIRVIDLADPQRTISTIAGTGAEGGEDGSGLGASFDSPTGLAYDGARYLYVSDLDRHTIRRIDLSLPNKTVVTIAGSQAGKSGYVDGIGADARFIEPDAIAVGPDGDLYVADKDSHAIRRIDLDDPQFRVTTFAGNGTLGFADLTGTGARLDDPRGICFDQAGAMYVSDSDNYRIRKITRDGQVLSVAGSGGEGSLNGPGSDATFKDMRHLAIAESGGKVVLYVTDESDNKVRAIDLTP